jgi:parallel beta-helix repeat protein
MRVRVALGALAALLIPSASFAAQACPDRTPASITTVAEASLKCQKTIAKVGSKFAKAKFKELSKCRLKEPTGSCPTAKNVEKIEKAAVKGQDKINKDCGLDSVQAGLTSSYKNETDDAVISSCMLSQHNVDVEVMVGEFTGMATEDPIQDANPKGREKCVKALSKLGLKYVLGALKISSKCIDKAMKDGVAGDLSPRCVGHYAGGVFVEPTDSKTADAIDKLNDKTEDQVDKQCEDTIANVDPNFGYIQTIFACPDAGTTADLQKCIVCNGWDGMVNLLEQEYAESYATFVTNGADAIQNAVDAATDGDKLLIQSGTYNEDVVVSTPNLKLVGCGGATNDRPRLVRSQGNTDAIKATSIDGLLFQSLDVFDWDDNGIFILNANGVTFRDIVGDGNLNTAYAVFPRFDSNVLIEACHVTQFNDAPIYVGQSSDIEVRYNTVTDSVSAIEIENCASASVHNNYATDNTAGILVFKDPTLPVQDSQDHRVFSNVFENNNTPNFGSGFVANVPKGTGMLIFSTDDSLFQGNIVRGHDQFGIVLTDQEAINALVSPPPFPVVSTPPDQQDSRRNKVRRNYVKFNGGNGIGGLVPAADLVLVLGDEGGGNHDNCMMPNTRGSFVPLTAQDCIPGP